MGATRIIDLNTIEGVAEHLRTLPTENLRAIDARPISPSNALLVCGADCELILREARASIQSNAAVGLVGE